MPAQAEKNQRPEGEGEMRDLKDQQPEFESAKPLQSAPGKRQLAASVYRLKPLPLGILGAMLISLLALLYLNEVGLAIQANQRLQQLASEQAQLQRENQYLRQQEGELQSPIYIENRAKQMGMVPADPNKVHIIVIPGLPVEDNRHTASLKACARF